MSASQGHYGDTLYERCTHCDSPILVASVDNELVPVDEYGEPFCNAECVADYADRQDERAFESFCEDFYGGSQPVTMEEQYQAAWEEKRKLS